MFHNQHILITGASAGLGESLAYSVAKRGGNLTLCARRFDKLEQIKSKLNKLYPNIKILILPCDVGNKSDCENLIKQSVSYFGELNYLIANAGKSMWCRFSDISDPDELKDLININYLGVVYTAYYALNYLRSSRGSYVAVSSILGAMPILYHSGYVAAKYAVNGFIESLRLEEPEINFLLAMPSWIAGTELRDNAVLSNKPEGIKVKKSHGKRTYTADQCAELIINAMIKKQPELYIPSIYRHVPGIRYVCKSLVDRIVSAKVAGELKD